VPTALWFVGAGLLTVVPLWMFGAAVQRIPLSTIGLFQYLTPMLQFAIGVTVYGESIAGGQIFGFTLVWIALAVFARDQITIARRLRMAT
jgi:chloramphenicol-sensitive protein RarD